MTPETLASFVVLGRVDNRPTDVCAAWIDSADRVCGKPAAEPWLCRRHVTVATKRADAYVAREADRRERAEARRIERAPKLRARMPTDNQIAELAQLVHERDRLRAEVGG